MLGSAKVYAEHNQIALITPFNRDGTVDFGLYDNDGPDGVPGTSDDFDAIVDLYGRVIGVNSAIFSTTGRAPGTRSCGLRRVLIPP